MTARRMQKVNILITSVVILVSVVAVGVVYFPQLMGLSAFSVEAGSMEPTIKKGSMVYVRRGYSAEDYRENDIVTFADSAGTKSFTHRIVHINAADNSFITKGDANKDVDLQPTSAVFAIGKVEFAVPFLGYAADFFRTPIVKVVLAVIYIAWAAIEIEVFLRRRREAKD